MAARKKKSSDPNRRGDEQVGSIRLYEYRRPVAGKGMQWGRWRVEAKKVTGKRPTFDSKEKAIEYAIECRNKYDDSKLRKEKLERAGADPLAVDAQLKIDQFNRESNDPSLTGVDALTLPSAVEYATALLNTVSKINAARPDDDQSAGGVHWMLGALETHIKREIFRQRQQVKYKTHIDEFMAFKTGSSGSKRGRTELQKETKREWQTYIGKNLRAWIGDEFVAEQNESQAVRETVINKIVEQKKPNGKPWSHTTKKKQADKAKQFGDWMQRKGYVANNPLQGIPDEFGSAPARDRIEFYSLDELKEMLRLAVEDDPNKAKHAKSFNDLIPFLVLNMFGSMRPKADVFSSNKRKFHGRKILRDQDWADHYPVRGKYIDLPEWDGDAGLPENRISKTKRRYGILFDVGYQWLQWWERECNGGNQLEDVFWGVKPMDRFKDQLSFPWIHNGLRHSACTYSSNHIRFDGAREWLAERFGHSLQTQNRFYTEPIKADQAAAFFDLTPEKVLG